MVSNTSTIYAYIGNRKGFNGGGNGGQGQNSGANGGGCTDIRFEGTKIEQRIMVAAAGGGGGGYSNSGTPNNRTRVSGGSGGNGDSNAYSYSTDTQCGMPGKKGENVYTSNGGIAGKYSSSYSRTDGT